MNSAQQAINSARTALEVGDPVAARAALTGINDPEAIYLLATAESRLGLLDEACASYARSLDLDPELDKARNALARLLIDLERYEDALAQYETLLQRNSASISARHGLGTALLGTGQCEHAENVFDTLIEEGCDRPAIRFMRARARLELGRVDEGIADLETSFEQQPTEISLRALAGALWMREERVRFGELLSRAAQSPALLAMAADLRRQSGDAEGAVGLIEGAGPAAKSADALATLSQAHVDLGDAESAEQAARDGVAADPRHRGVIANLIIALLMGNKAETALEIIGAMRAAEPLRQHWIAYQATAWRLLGDQRYTTLFDYERLVRVYELPVPDGFDSLGEFNSAFLDALNRWQLFETHPLDQSLRLGVQTSRDLTSIEDPVIEAYVKALDKPIRLYMSAVGGAADHPLSARNTGDYRISGSWSVRLHGRGWHVNHVHPEGWLSSAYYVTVPEDVDDANSRSGWIKFGEPPFACDPAAGPEHWIQPSAGMLVLFPSYLWHGTAPIKDGATRVTAPFDVVPR